MSSGVAYWPNYDQFEPGLLFTTTKKQTHTLNTKVYFFGHQWPQNKKIHTAGIVELPANAGHGGLSNQYRLLIRQQLDPIWKSEVLHHHWQFPALSVVFQHTDRRRTAGGFETEFNHGNLPQTVFHRTVRLLWPPWSGACSLGAPTYCWRRWNKLSFHPESPLGHWWTTIFCRRPPDLPTPTWWPRLRTENGAWISGTAGGSVSPEPDSPVVGLTSNKPR